MEVAKATRMSVRSGNAPNLYEVESETEQGKFYTVFCDGTRIRCECPGFVTHKKCKHLDRVRNYYLKETEGGREPEEEDHIVDANKMVNPDPPSTPSKWVKQIHGKDFITYEGLLALAHEQGLTALSAWLTHLDDKLAIACAEAIFKDGRTFLEAADATPDNVNVMVKAHFPRVALTRAKARVLRDALNIGMVAVEELGE
jgi:hypothetical protein